MMGFHNETSYDSMCFVIDNKHFVKINQGLVSFNHDEFSYLTKDEKGVFFLHLIFIFAVTQRNILDGFISGKDTIKLFTGEKDPNDSVSINIKGMTYIERQPTLADYWTCRAIDNILKQQGSKVMGYVDVQYNNLMKKHFPHLLTSGFQEPIL